MLKQELKASDFDERISAIRAARGDSVRLDDVADLVQSMMSSLEGDISAVEVQMHRELRELLAYMQQARQEIAQIKPGEIPSVHIPIATDELDAVVAATAEATNVILDAAEQLGKLAPSLSPEAAQVLDQVTTRIFEASNFQDITGQRITKVVRTLRHIECKIIALAKAFGEDVGEPAGGGAASGVPAGDERSLLNGPQLPQRANSQEDIDALLASFD